MVLFRRIFYLCPCRLSDIENMKQLLLFLFFSIFAPISAQYNPDLLGDGYEARTIQMPDDYEGRVVCTLVKKELEPQNDTHRAILYVHGYNDYFFQSQLGDSCLAHGYNFYALDLRKYGRSLLPHQDAFFCKDLKEYFQKRESFKFDDECDFNTWKSLYNWLERIDTNENKDN